MAAYIILAIVGVVYFVVMLIPIPRITFSGQQLKVDPVGTSILDRYWTLSVGWLAVIVGVSVWALVATLTAGRPWAATTLISAVVLIAGVFAFGLFFARFFVYSDTRKLKAKSVLSNRSEYNLPHEKVILRSKDGTLLRANHLKNGHDKIVIYLHGGFRSKDTFGSVMICEWLAEHYDIFSLDLRGHGESGGFYTGDGKTIEDLLAGIEYVKSQDYQKIGLIGRSMGAWTAVLQEARYHNVDSLVAAALPYRYISDCPPLKKIWPITVMNPVGAFIVARSARALRHKPHIEAGSPQEEIGNVAPTPLMMVYCDSDSFLGMSHDDMLQLYEKANDPKEIHFLPGDCHVYEVHLMHKYYQLLVNWFEKTL